MEGYSQRATNNGVTVEQDCPVAEIITYYGIDQAQRCRDALAVELEYLFDHEHRDRLAIRCGAPLNPDLSTVSGVYDRDHAVQLIDDLALRSIAGYMVWYTLNDFEPGVPTTNCLQRGRSIGKKDITKIRWLFLDFDPLGREKKQEASNDECANACAVMERAKNWLMEDYRFPEPVICMSGNGYQLKWKVDLPADAIGEKLIRNLVYILAARFTEDGVVDVDTAVWDRPRICKLPGTFSRKGVPTEARPQRFAHTVSRPATLEVIDAARLQQLIAAHSDLLEHVSAADTPRHAQRYAETRESRAGGGHLTAAQAHAKVQAWCAKHGIGYRIETSDGIAHYRLNRCLFFEAAQEEVAEHGAGNRCHIDVWEQETSTGKAGKIGAGCFTPWCQDYLRHSGLWGWDVLQRLADPAYAEQAHEWDTKREQRQHDREVEERFYAHAKAYSTSGAAPQCIEAHIFDPEEKTDNPLEALTFTKAFTDVAYDDASNALRVAEHYGQYVRFVHPSTGLMLWKGDVWRPHSAKLVRAYAWEITVKELTWVEEALAEAEHIEDAKERDAKMGVLSTKRGQIIASRGRHRLDACVDLVSSLPHLRCQEEEIDAKPFYFNVPHNTLHLDERRFRVYRPEPADLLTKQSSVKYAPKAPCPTWEAFIATIMQHNPEKIAYVQRWCGYALTGDIGEKAFCVLLGEPDTGKTTFVNVLMDIMGEYGVTARIQTFLAKHAEALTNDVARLARARVVSTSEANEHQIFSEEFVKLITGGGGSLPDFCIKKSLSLSRNSNCSLTRT